jgi:hypothetical protein
MSTSAFNKRNERVIDLMMKTLEGKDSVTKAEFMVPAVADEGFSMKWASNIIEMLVAAKRIKVEGNIDSFNCQISKA